MYAPPSPGLSHQLCDSSPAAMPEIPQPDARQLQSLPGMVAVPQLPWERNLRMPETEPHEIEGVKQT